MEFINRYKYIILSAVFLAMGYVVQTFTQFPANQLITGCLYGISYLLVGGPVWMSAFRSIRNGVIFTEFFLMGIATVGAFVLGEYVEGVAVMLFYMIGETVQHGAVHKARNSIKKLIDQQPEEARVKQGNEFVIVHPNEVKLGDVVQIRPGEKVPLDGKLLAESASLNSAALTGESKPLNRVKGEEIWAGSINQSDLIEIEVTHLFKDSKLSGILEMVQEATQRKAPTQRFMTRFARIYTPIVVWLAVAITFLPYLFVSDYVFQDWFYKALVLLVISCPCGLVISIPLGYFGGIGAASQNGILFKGSDYLDRIRKMNILFLDKTGTVTEGNFRLQNVHTYAGYTQEEVLKLAASVEQHSTHPIAKSIVKAADKISLIEPVNLKEHAGKGVAATLDGKSILIGNAELMQEFQVAIQNDIETLENTRVYISVDGEPVGNIEFGDAIKAEAEDAINHLRSQGVKQLVMLSGDHPEIVANVGEKLRFDAAFGGLLPQDKYNKVEAALNEESTVGFVGDGINDAPVVTLADIGIAMGGIGSDATVETADVVIQNDDLTKIPLAMNIAAFTHKIVWQNIVFALGIKIVVMILAFVGWANMWGAIFADVGVALIAIGNAIRIQYKYADGTPISALFETTDEDKAKQTAPTCCGEC